MKCNGAAGGSDQAVEAREGEKRGPRGRQRARGERERERKGVGRARGGFGRGGAAKSMHRRGMQRAAPTNTQSVSTTSERILPHFKTTASSSSWSQLLYATMSFSAVAFSTNFPRCVYLRLTAGDEDFYGGGGESCPQFICN